MDDVFENTIKREFLRMCVSHCVKYAEVKSCIPVNSSVQVRRLEGVFAK